MAITAKYFPLQIHRRSRHKVSGFPPSPDKAGNQGPQCATSMRSRFGLVDGPRLQHRDATGRADDTSGKWLTVVDYDCKTARLARNPGKHGPPAAPTRSRSRTTVGTVSTGRSGFHPGLARRAASISAVPRYVVPSARRNGKICADPTERPIAPPEEIAALPSRQSTVSAPIAA
jgi:hypothetical protein